MRDIFPMVPLAKKQAMCVGIMSYDGGVNFGLIGDYVAMPRLDDVAEHLTDALAELVATTSEAASAEEPAVVRARDAVGEA